MDLWTYLCLFMYIHLYTVLQEVACGQHFRHGLSKNRTSLSLLFTNIFDKMCLSTKLNLPGQYYSRPTPTHTDWESCVCVCVWIIYIKAVQTYWSFPPCTYDTSVKGAIVLGRNHFACCVYLKNDKRDVAIVLLCVVAICIT